MLLRLRTKVYRLSLSDRFCRFSASVALAANFRNHPAVDCRPPSRLSLDSTLPIVAGADIVSNRITIFDSLSNTWVRSYTVRGRVLQGAQEGEVRVFAHMDIIVTFDRIGYLVDMGLRLDYLTGTLPIFNGEEPSMGVFAETGAWEEGTQKLAIADSIQC